MHLTERDLAELAHGEATGAARPHVATHLASCAECSGRLEAIRTADRETAALLRLLDHPSPDVSVADVIAAARHTRRRRIGPIAAAITLCAAAAAAALPTSPLHRVIVHALERARAPRAATAPPSRDTSAAQVARPAAVETTAGISVTPGPVLEVRFRSWQPTGRLRIAFADSGAASLVSSGGAAAFALGRGEIVVDNRGAPASFTLTIPRTVSVVRVRVDTTVVFRKSAGGISSLASPDAAGGYTLELVAMPRR